jgi:hypothetical protein
MVFGCFMTLLPWIFRRPLDLWVVEKLGGHPPEKNPQLPTVIQETVALAHELHKKAGHWPAFLILTSHPETTGPLEWLRFELLRQALHVADAVAQARSPKTLFLPRPRCFLAIDPFALDTVSVPAAAFYAAWMHRIYLAWDRQPSTQSWLQRHFFLRGSGYDRIAWRLLHHLKRDVPVIMALGGGLPQNARLFYAAREFIQRMRPLRWRYAKRDAEKKLLDILLKPVGGALPAAKGELPPITQSEIRRLLEEIGLSASETESALREFQEEFRLPVPYRVRLFSVLMNRLVRKGKPLLLLAASHADTPPHIRFSRPLGVLQVADSASFAKDFVKKNFLPG